MRISFITIGVIFLVLGTMMYFVPMQKLKADTTTTNIENQDTRTSSIIVSIPAEWAYTSGIIGLILLILGLAIPNPKRKRDLKKGSYEPKEN